jgi:hypothetical protein
MSKPLSILLTLLLLFVPPLVSERCAGSGSAVPPCGIDAGSSAVPPEARLAAPPSAPRAGAGPRQVWGGPWPWLFAAQGVVLSVVERVVLDGAGTKG